MNIPIPEAIVLLLAVITMVLCARYLCREERPS